MLPTEGKRFTANLTIRLSPAMLEALQAESKRSNIPQGVIVRQAIAQALDMNKKEAK